MKTLLLVRHAKSSWSDQAVRDHERPLNPRGRHDASMMAEYVRGLGIAPDLISSSTALRTRSTALAFADSLSYPPGSIHFAEELYLASARTITQFIAGLGGDIGCAIIVGHNPGISHAGALIGRTHERDMPTCAVLCLESESPDWEHAIKDGGFISRFYATPKSLA